MQDERAGRSVPRRLSSESRSAVPFGPQRVPLHLSDIFVVFDQDEAISHSRSTSNRRVVRGINVHGEETFGRGRQDDRLGNDSKTVRWSAPSRSTSIPTPRR